MDYELTGKRVLVTGASRGLGLALATDFALGGARVAACARGQAGLDELAREIGAAGGESMVAALDVADADAVRAFVERAESDWGGIDALVNNASLLGPRRPLRIYPLNEWRRVLEVNLTGALVATLAVLPAMRRAAGGSIINVTSGVGNQPRADWGAYAISKWGLEALTYNLSQEERDAGIRVNAVDPGAMRTAMRRSAYPQEDPASLPDPADVTAVFLWLASDDSRGVTGQRFRAQEWRRPD